MRSIFGLFTGLCIVSLCKVAYIDKNKTKHRVPGLRMLKRTNYRKRYTLLKELKIYTSNERPFLRKRQDGTCDE